jgi:hypothetical protein
MSYSILFSLISDNSTPLGYYPKKKKNLVEVIELLLEKIPKSTHKQTFTHDK